MSVIVDLLGLEILPDELALLKVAVIAMITNFATGLAATSHSHKAVVEMASQSSEKVCVLLKQFIQTLA